MACINRAQGAKRKTSRKRRPPCFGDISDIPRVYCDACPNTTRLACIRRELAVLEDDDVRGPSTAVMEAYREQSILAENPMTRPSCFGQYDGDDEYCEDCAQFAGCREGWDSFAERARRVDEAARPKKKTPVKRAKPAPPPEKLPLRKILIKPRPGDEHA